MASATTRPSFTFNFSPSSSSKFKPHCLSFQPQIPKIHSIPPLHSLPKRQLTSAKSIDVSKEDRSISEGGGEKNPSTISDGIEEFEQQENPDDKRLEEKFAVLNTGIYECRSCGYKYDEAAGDPSYPVPPGLPFDRLPDDWRCPTCGASKSFFESKSVEIAGFAQNQQFGLGGNTLTSGQKLLLIYGGLFLGFLFFLSGYFLQ